MTLKSNNIHYELPALTYGFTKGLLLMSKRTPFEVQKDSF